MLKFKIKYLRERKYFKNEFYFDNEKNVLNTDTQVQRFFNGKAKKLTTSGIL